MATCDRAEELAIDHMCDPRKWMPVPRVKSGKRPGEPLERHTAIHHWVLLDIRKVIDRDEATPYQLRIDPKRHYRQTEQDEKNAFGVRPLAAVKPTASLFCAIRS